MIIQREFTEISQLTAMRDGFIALFGTEPTMRLNRDIAATDKAGDLVFFSRPLLITAIGVVYVTVDCDADEARVNIRENIAGDSTPFVVTFEATV